LREVTIRSILKTGKHDILHAFNGRALSNGLIASAGVPVKTIGVCGTMGHLNWWDPSAYLAVMNPTVDRIVCISKAIMTYLQSRGIPEKRLVQIYRGHDPVWFTAAPRQALCQFGIPEDAFVIGCTAKIRPIKGVPILIEAVRRLAPEFPVHLMLVGQNADTEVQRLFKDPCFRERVHLTGFRMDAPDLIGACDLFVMPTLKNEGLCKAVLEAMCMGVPPIVSAVGGMVELVEEGRTGAIVPPGDPGALAEAIKRYILDKRLCQRHGQASKERVMACFSFPKMANQTINLYNDLLAH